MLRRNNAEVAHLLFGKTPMKVIFEQHKAHRKRY